MRKRELKNMEWWVLIIAIILCSIGLIALFSATQETEHDCKGIADFLYSIFNFISSGTFYKAS